MSFFRRVLFFTLILFSVQAWAVTFTVRNIQINGLQRIRRGTVLTYLPVKVGQRLNTSRTGGIIRSLYATGFFSDVNLARNGNTLIVNVVERPIITDIRISGNKKIKTKKLLSVMKTIGVSSGDVFNRSTLNAVKQTLEQQYFNLGHYNAKVRTQVRLEPRDRAAIYINISEGSVAKIREITIIGNGAFSNSQLLSQFKLSESSIWTYFTHNDQYSRQQLNADLERLRSFYLDRGYLKFAVDSTQVSITPDRSDVYIVVHVSEGPVYHISSIKFQGNLINHADEIKQLITVKSGDVFSRKTIIANDEKVNQYFADRGYAFANINALPKINDISRTVSLTFKVQPGQRIYVRRITFSGNNRTADNVLRREMRQMPGALFSMKNINESKRRLANLGYLQNIQVQTHHVPGHPDQVDLDYNVHEASSATANLQAGYSDTYGFLYGANVSERNFMGSGKGVSLLFQKNAYLRSFVFNYVNPYYTVDGISRSLHISTQKVTPGDVHLASYTTDNYGVGMTYGIPLSEYNRLTFGYGYTHMVLHPTSDSSREIRNLISREGSRFDQTQTTLGWQHSSYDRVINPTSGLKEILNLEVGLPVLHRSLDYYKINYEAAYYYPFTKQYILKLHTNLGYGDGYNKGKDLPFFKNYYSGGIDSVRGYEANSLGPKDSKGQPLGGNILVAGGVEFIFPNPVTDHIRTGVFVDAGNVYDNKLQLGQLRYSVGLSATWYSPFGPLEFSLAKALNAHHGDDTKVFQFSIGTSL